MKTIRLLIYVLVVVACSSCKESKAEFTPYIQVSHFYLNPKYEGEKIIAAQDTLLYAFKDGAYVLDTINMGDEPKVAFQVLFGSYANDLISTRVTFDTTQLDMQAKLSTELRSILLPSSDLRTIQLYINPGFNCVSFPVTYRPLKSGTFQFSLMVESDSELSPSTVVFKQPVR